MARSVLMFLVPVVLAGCSQSSPEPAGTGASGAPAASSGSAGPVEPDPALRRELVAMLADDQAGIGSDEERQARLAEIFDEHGWPGFDLVGREAGDAAWAIAQHADLDVAFQERALELLESAVAARQASPGNLAYLSDRVAVNRGEPQSFGTQIRCAADGSGPVAATPIDDEDGVEQRRAEAGLEPLSDYLETMTEICAQDG